MRFGGRMWRPGSNLLFAALIVVLTGPATIAQDLRILSARVVDAEFIEIQWTEDAESYFRVLSGSSLDSITSPAALALDNTIRLRLSSDPIRLFRVERVSRAADVDTDGDGLPDLAELELGFDPLDPDENNNGIADGLDDLDGDGLSNLGEWLLGLDARIPDTDGNGIRDGDEDADGDGLSNSQEVGLGTNPLLADTDSDGWPDEAEVTAGSDPLDVNSRPKWMLAATPVVLTLPTIALLSGESANTVAAMPSVSTILPSPGGMGGLVPNATYAHPSVEFILPAAFGDQGVAANTVVARPPVELILPGAGEEGGLAPNVVLALPPLDIDFESE